MSLLWLILLPLLGGFFAWFAERIHDDLPRWVSLLTCTATLLLLAALAVSALSGPATDSWLLYGRIDWIPRFGISVELGMDGLSLLMLALTLILGLIAVASSWTEIDSRPGFFQANLLWALAGVCGVFLALDLVLFFLFWEVMLVPMYLLIAIWGHERRAYAAMKFFIFTQVSGLLMLLAIVALAWQGAAQNGAISFSYQDLLGLDLSSGMGFWLMLGFFLAFTVKLPAFPFHTWLPDAHTQAPTAGSVLLAGILLKTGAYGLLRFTLPLFPEASVAIAPAAMALGVAGVVYGALLAFAQTDFKRLVAYSSVSHMGFVLLGIYAFNELALQGAVMQMVTHGASTAALFMMAGALQHRLHTRDMREMGGLWQQAPRMGACAMFFVLASLGLPGLGNFVAEFLVLLGLFAVAPWMAAAAAVGMVTAAVYSLWLMQQSFQGKPDPDRVMSDFGVREMTAMAVLMLALLWTGLYPQPILNLAEPAVRGVQYLMAGPLQAASVVLP
ncbi:MAG: NADH-quinone oxidoreductase subunit M [Alcanivoracaceae bacterium]|jgi:NADH-quinone oxidoreductase subunit M|nr:NADH-quinone oxidoreductase subunit M [Alcanivoracaceae bacterium]